MNRRIAVVLLGAHVLTFLGLTLLSFPQAHPPVNVVPFRSMTHDLKEGGRHLGVNFVGNLAAFLPLGVLIPFAEPRLASGRWIALIAALFSGFVEVAQYLSARRVADIDDVILNVAGALISYASYRLYWANPYPR